MLSAPAAGAQKVCYLRGRRVAAAPPHPCALHARLCVHSGDDRATSGALLMGTSPPD